VLVPRVHRGGGTPRGLNKLLSISLHHRAQEAGTNLTQHIAIQAFSMFSLCRPGTAEQDKALLCGTKQEHFTQHSESLAPPSPPPFTLSTSYRTCPSINYIFLSLRTLRAQTGHGGRCNMPEELLQLAVQLDAPGPPVLLLQRCSGCPRPHSSTSCSRPSRAPGAPFKPCAYDWPRPAPWSAPWFGWRRMDGYWYCQRLAGLLLALPFAKPGASSATSLLSSVAQERSTAETKKKERKKCGKPVSNGAPGVVVPAHGEGDGRGAQGHPRPKTASHLLFNAPLRASTHAFLLPFIALVKLFRE